MPVSNMLSPSHIGDNADAVMTGALGSFSVTGPAMFE